MVRQGRTLPTYDPDYYGETSGTTIDFYARSAIPYQNLYHEFAHVLNNVTNNSFENIVGAQAHYIGPDYTFGGDGVGEMSTRPGRGFTSSRVPDPNMGDIVALQHPSSDPAEQWADLFANHVSGNIDLASIAGQLINSSVTGYLFPCVYARITDQ